jgi:hypothetical protein
MYTATAQRPTAFGISEFGAQVSPRVAPTAPRLKITRRGRLVLSALVAAPLVIGAVVVGVNAGGAVANSSTGHTAFDYETIASGETLWHLAESVAPAADPRDVIADIMRLNGLETASVVPGQRIAIPTQYS